MRRSFAEGFVFQIARLRLRRVFEEIFVAGSLLDGCSQSVLVAANHCCRWDASVAMLVADAEKLNYASFAHEDILRRYPYLKHAGQIGIPRGNALAAAKVLSAAGKRLADSRGSSLWIFPQGQHARMHTSLAVQTGTLALRRMAPNVRYAVVAMHYEFFRTAKPWVWVKISSINDAEPASGAELGQKLDEVYDELLGDLRGSKAHYKPILTPRKATLAISGFPVSVREINQILQSNKATKNTHLEVNKDHTALRIRPSSVRGQRNDLLSAIAEVAGPLLAERVGQAIID